MTIKEYESKINDLLEEIKKYGLAIVNFKNKHSIDNLDGYLEITEYIDFIFPPENAGEVIGKLKRDYTYSLNDFVSCVKGYYSNILQEMKNRELNERFGKKMFEESLDEVEVPEWIEDYGIMKLVCVENLWLEARLLTKKDDKGNWNRELCVEQYSLDYYDIDGILDYFKPCTIFQVNIRQKVLEIEGKFYSIDPISAALSLALKKIESQEFRQNFYRCYFYFLKDELEKFKRTYLFLLSQHYKDELIALENGDKVIADKKVVIGPACMNVDEILSLGNRNNSEVKNNEVKRGPTLKRKRVGAKIN